jgi:hypothetical protein
MKDIERFCEILRKRSSEHSEAMNRMYDLPGMMASILRQELDSMVRVIYLLAIDDLVERYRLVNQTLNGQVWTVTTVNGKQKKITDREMVELSDGLQGWTSSVYKFGCAFIHLSNFHNYSDLNPFDTLSVVEQRDMLSHLRHYHWGPQDDHPDFAELASYFPSVFRKIASNLAGYINNLESETVQSLT